MSGTHPTTTDKGAVGRWTAKRKAAVVVDLIKGKTTAAEVERWKEDFLEGGQEQLRSHPRDAEARFAAEKKELLAKVGELTMQMEVYKIACEVQGLPCRGAASPARSDTAEPERTGG